MHGQAMKSVARRMEEEFDGKIEEES